MGIRIGRRLEELAARLGQDNMGHKKKASESDTSSSLDATDSSDQKPKRRLVRDIEVVQKQKKDEERAAKEARRAAAKQQTAAQSPAQKYADEKTIHEALENTEGSYLQKKRLDREAKDRKKLAKAHRADLEARVEEDRERRIIPVREFDREQAELEAEERARLEAEEVKRLELYATELERARDEQARNDAAQGVYHEGNYAYLQDNQAKEDAEDDVDIDDASYDQYDAFPKQIGSRRAVQAEEDAIPRADKPRARKSGVKPETHHALTPAEQRQTSKGIERDEHDKNEYVKRVRRRLKGADEDLQNIQYELDEARERLAALRTGSLREYYVGLEKTLLGELELYKKRKEDLVSSLARIEQKDGQKRKNGSIGAEPDYDASEWVEFLDQMEKREKVQEEADAQDLHEVYEILFDFYEGKDGKKGVGALDVDGIIFETQDNEIAARRYTNRWENITNPVVLEYPNAKGETFGNILNRYLDKVFSFYRDNLDELQKLGVADEHTDLPTMAQQALRGIIWHGDIYNSSLNIPLTKIAPAYEFGQVVDPVIRYMEDACMKLEEHFDTRILNKLRTRTGDADYKMYMKGLRLLNDLYQERQEFLTFKKTEQIAR